MVLVLPVCRWCCLFVRVWGQNTGLSTAWVLLAGFKGSEVWGLGFRVGWFKGSEVWGLGFRVGLVLCSVLGKFVCGPCDLRLWGFWAAGLNPRAGSTRSLKTPSSSKAATSSTLTPNLQPQLHVEASIQPCCKWFLRLHQNQGHGFLSSCKKRVVPLRKEAPVAAQAMWQGRKRNGCGGVRGTFDGPGPATAATPKP